MLSGWSRRVVIGAVAAAVVPLLVGVIVVLSRGEFAAHGDDALLELRASFAVDAALPCDSRCR